MLQSIEMEEDFKEEEIYKPASMYKAHLYKKVEEKYLDDSLQDPVTEYRSIWNNQS